MVFSTTEHRDFYMTLKLELSLQGYSQAFPWELNSYGLCHTGMKQSALTGTT